MDKSKDRIWISAKEWKELEDKDDQNYCLQKDVVDSVIKAEGEGRTVKFAVSKDTEDRDGDTIKQTGWELTNFKKNPVVPFGHNYKDLPIAKSLSIEVVKNQLVSVAEFVTREVYPFADTVYQMLKGGFLNATSVGFKPLAYEQNDERGGYDFLKQELLEYSVVPIPSNPDALVQARDAGIDTTLLKEWAERVLDSFGEDTAKSLMITKSELEELFKKISGNTNIYLTSAAVSDEEVQKMKKNNAPVEDVNKDNTDAANTDTVKAEDLPTEKPETKDTEPEKKEDEANTEQAPTYLDIMSQELILRGFSVKRDDQVIEKNEKILEGKDYSHFSDDQIFDFMLRQIGETDTTFTIKDELFDYELTELENKDEQLTEDQVHENQKAPVEKLNPVIMGCLMPKSFEAISSQLRSSAGNYLTGNGENYNKDDEFIINIATFQRTSLFAVLGYRRSYEEDPVYEGTWRMNGRLGLPEWTGAPKKVDVVVSMEVVDELTDGKAASLKEEKSGSETEEPKKKEDDQVKDEEPKVEKDPGDDALDLEEDPVEKAGQEVDNKFSNLSKLIAEAVSQGLRQAQGKLD